MLILEGIYPLIFFVRRLKDMEKAVEIIKASKYGENAQIIGTVCDGEGVTLTTSLGGKRRVNVLIGEGLPRIC